MASPTFVIVGANACGTTAAATLREEGFDGRIVLIGDERRLPFERPPLSKEYLRGDMLIEKAYLRPTEWYEENKIETMFGAKVYQVDPHEMKVHLTDSESHEPIAFDQCLVATGVRNRKLNVPGKELAGILELRSPIDSDSIRSWATRSLRAVIAGMGFIGCEVAASLRQMGIDVTAVDVVQVPLQRVLGKELGHVFEMIHQERGVRMVFEDTVVAFRGTETVEEVLTKNGERLACDFVVVGIGTIPNTEVVEGTGIAIENGIVVDEWLRTNAPGVFAAGDVANHKHPLYGPLRIEHFDNAIKMGQTAARNMMENWEVFDDPHWFWSDQYDTSLQMAGIVTEYDEMIVRGGRLQDRKFVAFFMRSGVIQAAVSVNYPRDVRRSLDLIKSRTPIFEKQSLKNPEVDLRTLVPASHESGV